MSVSACKRRQREGQKLSLKVSNNVTHCNKADSSEEHQVHTRLTEISVLKAKKKLEEVHKQSDTLLEQYGISQISKITCLDNSKVCQLLNTTPGKSTEKYSWKIAPDVVDEVQSFYRTSEILYNLPDMCFCTRRYMRMSIGQAYDLYSLGKMSSKRTVACSTFGKLELKDVVTIDKTPDRQCCCKECKNFRIVILAMNQHGFKSLGANSMNCIEDSLCKLSQLPNSRNTSHKFTKIPKKLCSLCKCKNCGAINEKKHLLKENTPLWRDDEIIHWKQWMKKTGVKKYNAEGFKVEINSKSTKSQSLSEVFMSETPLRLLLYYTDLLKDMSLHHFNTC